MVGKRGCLGVFEAVANEACLRNDIEVQNYVLQVPYAPVPVDGDEAVSSMQARSGRSVLAFSDYMIFSPTPAYLSPYSG